jgi:cobalt/nickel transport system permease protein
VIPADPRLRIVAAFAAVLSLSQLTLLPLAAAACAGALVAAALSPAGVPWRRLVHVEGFVLLLLVALPLTVPGTPLLQAGPLVASAEGLAFAALLGCKITAAVLILTVLLSGLDPVRLGGALGALRVPPRLVALFVATARYSETIRQEAGRLRGAMRARGFRPRTDLHTLRSYGNLMGMLLVRSLDRAERVGEAMRARGFTGHMPRPELSPPTRPDIARAGLIAGFAALLFLGDRAWPILSS